MSDNSTAHGCAIRIITPASIAICVTVALPLAVYACFPLRTTDSHALLENRAVVLCSHKFSADVDRFDVSGSTLKVRTGCASQFPLCWRAPCATRGTCYGDLHCPWQLKVASAVTSRTSSLTWSLGGNN
eukprot:9001393-Alexandrium_andersonii.AAC.1